MAFVPNKYMLSGLGELVAEPLFIFNWIIFIIRAREG